MQQVLRAVLPLAVGVALSPLPVIAVILMLLTPTEGRRSLWFLGGWVVGIACECALFVLISARLDLSTDPSSETTGRLQIALGGVLLLLALLLWLQRRTRSHTDGIPTWIERV